MSFLEVGDCEFNYSQNPTATVFESGSTDFVTTPVVQGERKKL